MHLDGGRNDRFGPIGCLEHQSFKIRFNDSLVAHSEYTHCLGESVHGFGAVIEHVNLGCCTDERNEVRQAFRVSLADFGFWDLMTSTNYPRPHTRDVQFR